MTVFKFDITIENIEDQNSYTYIRQNLF